MGSFLISPNRDEVSHVRKALFNDALQEEDERGGNLYSQEDDLLQVHVPLSDPVKVTWATLAAKQLRSSPLIIPLEAIETPPGTPPAPPKPPRTPSGGANRRILKPRRQRATSAGNLKLCTPLEEASYSVRCGVIRSQSVTMVPNANENEKKAGGFRFSVPKSSAFNEILL